MERPRQSFNVLEKLTQCICPSRAAMISFAASRPLSLLPSQPASTFWGSSQFHAACRCVRYAMVA